MPLTSVSSGLRCTPAHGPVGAGVDSGGRTRNLLIGNQMLSQLSYIHVWSRIVDYILQGVRRAQAMTTLFWRKMQESNPLSDFTPHRGSNPEPYHSANLPDGVSYPGDHGRGTDKPSHGPQVLALWVEGIPAYRYRSGGNYGNRTHDTFRCYGLANRCLTTRPRIHGASHRIRTCIISLLKRTRLPIASDWPVTPVFMNRPGVAAIRAPTGNRIRVYALPRRCFATKP